MKSLFLSVGLFCLSLCSLKAQNSLRVSIIDQSSKKALAGVQVLLQPSGVGGLTDQNGRVFVSGIKDSTQVLSLVLAGYQSVIQKVIMPIANGRQLVFALKPSIQSESNIQIMASRNGAYIEQLPYSVEVQGLGNINKKMLESSGNIGRIFSDNSAISLQQTSGLSGDFQLRIRGLEGKYTQILKDGLPLFGGLGHSFSLLQMPVADLQQIEIIKGSASALYGGDAIAGVINLVSKRPDQQPQSVGFVNATQKGGISLGDYRSLKLADDLALSLPTTFNAQSAFDVDNDGVADLPKSQTFRIAPTLYYEIDRRTHLDFGIDYTADTRTGGVIDAIQSSYSSFLKETNDSKRTSTHVNFETKDRSGGIIRAKNGIVFFNRNISQPQGTFAGKQFATYSEITYQWQANVSHQWLFGGVFSSDDFTEENGKLDYFYRAFGGFAQDDWRILPALSLQASLRADYVWKTYPIVRSRGQGYVMPKLSIKYKILDELTARVSSGLGYKNPSLFNYQTEQQGLWNVQPLSNKLEAEKSFNVNADFDYTKQLGGVQLDISQGVFYTNLQNYLSLVNNVFVNSPNIAIVKGFETNLQAKYDKFKAVLGYTYTSSDLDGKPLPFAPRSKTVASLQYEKVDLYSANIELMLIGKQYLGNNQFGQAFGLINLKGERHFGKYSIVGRIQNLGNVRQSNWNKTTTLTNPEVFNPIYAPLEGILMNIGVKVRW